MNGKKQRPDPLSYKISVSSWESPSRSGPPCAPATPAPHGERLLQGRSSPPRAAWLWSCQGRSGGGPAPAAPYPRARFLLRGEEVELGEGRGAAAVGGAASSSFSPALSCSRAGERSGQGPAATPTQPLKGTPRGEREAGAAAAPRQRGEHCISAARLLLCLLPTAPCQGELPDCSPPTRSRGGRFCGWDSAARGSPPPLLRGEAREGTPLRPQPARRERGDRECAALRGFLRREEADEREQRGGADYCILILCLAQRRDAAEESPRAVCLLAPGGGSLFVCHVNPLLAGRSPRQSPIEKRAGEVQQLQGEAGERQATLPREQEPPEGRGQAGVGLSPPPPRVSLSFPGWSWAREPNPVRGERDAARSP
nr:uncharacterized protein LOC122174094 [Chrysemys picta bellii]